MPRDMTIPVGPWAVDEAWGMEAHRQFVQLSQADIQARMSRGYDDNEEESPPYALLDQGVALIAISDVITKKPTCMSLFFGGTSTIQTRHALRLAMQDPKVRSVMFMIDSPGGQTAGVGDLASDIARFKHQKPIAAYCEDMCCSAAYWIACQCDAIFCNPTCQMANIGTYMVVQDTSRRAASAGIEPIVIKAGAFKGAGVDGTKVTEAQITEWRRNVKAVNAQFVKAVAAGRKLSESDADKWADGRVHVGEAAKDMGLVDAVCTMEEALSYLTKSMATGFSMLHLMADMPTGLDTHSNNVDTSLSSSGRHPVNDSGTADDRDLETLAATSPGQSGTEDMTTMPNWIKAAQSWLSRMPEDFDPTAEGAVDTTSASHSTSASPAVVAFDDSELKGEIGALKALVTTQADQISSLKAELAATASEKRLQANLASVDKLQRQMKVDKAEADSYRKLAAEKPDAFEAVLPTLDARTPIPALAGMPIATMGNIGGSAYGQFQTLVEAKQKANPTLTATEAWNAVQRENPALAQEVRDESLSSMPTTGDDSAV